jgi:hypothetical protein
MLLEMGIPERVVDHWNYRVELGVSSLVFFPAHRTTVIFLCSQI